jgi:hypothetical protein
VEKGKRMKNLIYMNDSVEVYRKEDNYEMYVGGQPFIVNPKEFKKLYGKQILGILNGLNKIDMKLFDRVRDYVPVGDLERLVEGIKDVEEHS